MIVTEYVPRGNLKDLLHGSDVPISLDARLCIAIECADALGYMHSSMYQPMIHGDIKPDNILLDNNLGVKLSDFGLSRLLSMHQTQHTANVIGSRGYMDPEYIDTGVLDPKIDVYSFGVVLLELITRAKASEIGFGTGLKRNFTDALGKGKQEARKMFDTEIANDRDIDILDKIGNLAAQCFKDIKERPEMKEVLRNLHMLRRSLHCEKAEEKIGRQSSSGTQIITQKVDDHGSSIPRSRSNSSVTYKFSILDIFKRKSRYESYGGSILKSLNVTSFTSKELRKITDNYSTLIGRSFNSSVYLGRIDCQDVVVKRYTPMDRTFDKDKFVRAMVSASTIHHMNIIELLGCCLETEPPQLVFEYAHHQGDLHDHLHCYNGTLSLDLRLDIAIGSAVALKYLHSTQIMYGNITSANILVGHNFLPKVSDIVSIHMVTFISEDKFSPPFNIHYTDPAYLRTGRFTSKSDVYSFGVVLLELITRKRPRMDGNSSLVLEYLKAFSNENSGKAMFDKEIAVEGNMLIVEGMGKVAVDYLRDDEDEQPVMAEVVECLQKLRRDLKHAEEGLQDATASHASDE